MTGVIGFLKVALAFLDWVGAIGEGMTDMFSITIVAILISGLIGLVKFYGGIDWIVNILHQKLKTEKCRVRSKSYLEALIISSSKQHYCNNYYLTHKQKKLEKIQVALKAANLIDIFACAFIALTPYIFSRMLMITALVDVSPLEV